MTQCRMHLSAFVLVVLINWTSSTSELSHSREQAQVLARILFSKYGNNETLSYEGFEHLIENLGIGNLAIEDHQLKAHFKDGAFNTIHVTHKHAHDHGEEEESETSHEDHAGGHGETSHESQRAEDSHEGGSDRKKRDTTRSRRSIPTTNSSAELITQCLPPSALLQLYGLDTNSSLDTEAFLYVCPAIILQIEQQICPRPHVHTGGCGKNSESTATGTLPAKRWAYPIVAVLLVSLVGVLCVGIVPLLRGKFFVHLLHYLVALAVGSLTGDALLHLIPHALAPMHAHEHGEDDGGEDDHRHSNAVWKGMATLFGLFAFFLFERCLGILTDCREQEAREKEERERQVEIITQILDRQESHTETSRPVPQGGRRPSRVKRSSISYYLTELDEDQPLTPVKPRLARRTVSEAGYETRELENLKEEDEERRTPRSTPRTSQSYQKSEEPTRGHGHSHALPSSLSAMACMVIMGDGLHNLCDGLAIGAAFASSLTAGLSTSLAVLCHELPHELGDFAVLLKDGMSYKRALFFNVVSSILCFAGMIIGVFVGHLGSVSDWIFCGVAGMFIYISLADMLPQLDDKETVKLTHKIRNLFLQILGVSTGVVIMLFIALYEEKIMISLGD